MAGAQARPPRLPSMAYGNGEARTGRLTAAAVSGAIQLAAVAALLAGLAGRTGSTEAQQAVSAFSVPPPPQPPQEQRETTKASEPEGRTGSALPREAPRPRVPMPAEPAAPKAQTGSSAAEATGGTGSGLGSGAGGDGTGGGGLASGPRRISGQLTDRDYPAEAARVRAAGTVFVMLRIGSDGRVAGCTIDRSSGFAILDQTTCRLAQSRFRYAPARDATGRAIPASIGTSFTWGTRN